MFFNALLNGQREVDLYFNSCCWHADDPNVSNNKKSQTKFDPYIYPRHLKVSETTEFGPVHDVSYLDLLLSEYRTIQSIQDLGRA